MELLQCVKQFFNHFVSRKRSREPDCLSYHSPKHRRLALKMSSRKDNLGILDEIISNASSSSSKVRKSTFNNHSALYKTAREVPTINLDEEDDDVILMTAKESINNSRRSGKFGIPDIDDDVRITKVYEPFDSKVTARRRRSNKLPSPLGFSGPFLNGTSRRTSANGFEASSPLMNSSRGSASKFGISPAYRLDEKDMYKKLLADSSNNVNGSILGFSPLERSSFFRRSDGFSNRSQKLVELAQKQAERVIDVVDLTDTKKTNLSTRDTIQNVIDKFESDAINVHSDSSDVEILPTPPSPKSDFNVKRVNSLKTFVDVTQPEHTNWTKNLVTKHHEILANRQRAIAETLLYNKQHSEINQELKTKRQEDDIRKCLKIKEHLLPIVLEPESVPLPDLTDEQENKIDQALDKYADDGEILSSKFNLNIARRDLRTLSGLNWLNDEVINFYMNLLMERGKDSKYPSTYATNTFFYPKLLKDGHSSIRRWTRKVDIFAHDLMVVPIHLRMHWCMAIVDFRNKNITYYDSMGSPNKLCLETIYRYLREEHLDKKKSEFDCSDWELINAQDIPQQMNGSDCGMFSCTFAEFISRDAKITFSQDDMPYLRRKMVLEILEGRLLID